MAAAAGLGAMGIVRLTGSIQRPCVTVRLHARSTGEYLESGSREPRHRHSALSPIHVLGRVRDELSSRLGSSNSIARGGVPEDYSDG